MAAVIAGIPQCAVCIVALIWCTQIGACVCCSACDAVAFAVHSCPSNGSGDVIIEPWRYAEAFEHGLALEAKLFDALVASPQVCGCGFGAGGLRALKRLRRPCFGPRGRV